ncbi:MAG: hypothetical protein ABIT38_23055, partial [Gemmatimonadaceae bacterium]
MSTADKPATAIGSRATMLDGRQDSWWKRKRVGILAGLGGLVVRMLAATWRLQLERREVLDGFRA